MGKAVGDKLTTVPVIDFSGLSDPARRSSICAELARACETTGFFEMINSGISLEALDDAFDVNRDFFALPMEDKLILKPEFRPPIPAYGVGYKRAPPQSKNNLETIAFRHYVSQESSSPEGIQKSIHSKGLSGDIIPTPDTFPDSPRDYREKVLRLTVEIGKVADTLLDVCSESLGLPPTYLREEQHKNTTIPRVINFHHYPKGKKPVVDDGSAGILPHQDSSIFTIVAQGYDTQGLEVFLDGDWIPILPQRGGLIVNVGDVLQAWSNNRYKSILHRVISNKETGRYSLAYFIYPVSNPEIEFVMQPISKLVSGENPPAFEPFLYLDSIKSKGKRMGLEQKVGPKAIST